MLLRPPGTLRASGRAMRRALFLALLLWATPAAADHDHNHDSDSDPDPDPELHHEHEHDRQGFSFGSYGRVVAGSDLRGSSPEPVNVVAHGPRVVEPSYLELDLYYRMRAPRGVDVTTVTTIAFGDSLFHATGTFDARVALRNLYLLAEKDLTCGRLGLWAGSRMLRGDDIYLLDYWPLDDVNTVGAGATLASGPLDTGVHAGLNRLLDPYQFQEREVFTPEEGTETIPELDRQRFIGTAQASYRFLGTGAPDVLSARVKLYAEAQALPSGTRRMEDDSVEKLPTDAGWSLGAQLALWGFAPGASHANLFARHSRGLTAYDELDTPMDLDTDKKSSGASELVLGLGGNVEQPWGGALLGATTRRFTDGDPSSSDPDDGWEYALDARPRARVLADLEAAVDVSWQVRFPRGLSPTTLSAADPAVFQIAPMALYSPFGPGSYARPQLRLVYRAAHLNAAARDQLYALEDPRRTLTWVHFLGVQAEWWFNSSTYRR
ncbi:MAG TPA: carbohydrate porin [Kofleriaceae bacterium]|nr:carbohydrate porin [Kofleriaceae bacterium]